MMVARLILKDGMVILVPSGYVTRLYAAAGNLPLWS
jgi:hypothetical protein